jgi:hypothetical protein
MKSKSLKLSVILPVTIFCLSISVNAQTTYTWNGGTTSWNTPANWTPARTTPASNDILVINASNTIVLDFTSPETIGQLKITGASSAVIFQTGATRVLNIGASVAGDDFTISTGSSLTVQSIVNTIGLTIAMVTGNTASISGAINFGSGASTAQAHRLTTADAAGISFESGSSFTTAGVSSGSPFGTTGAAVTNNNIVFKSGSNFNFGGGANPFGATAPASLIQFQSGSSYGHNSTGAPSLSGRYYANFILNANITSAGSFGKIDNLTIKAGSTFTVSTTNNRFSITGNITVEPGAAFTTAGPLYPDLLFIGTGTLQTIDFGSSNPSFRSISVGTDANVIFATNCGINTAAIATGVTSNIYGNLNLADKVITGTAGTGTPLFINRSASTVAAQIATTALSANSNVIVTNNPSGISNGMLINFPGVFPANTYIISTSTGTFTTSKFSVAPAAIGASFTITNNNATLSTSNSGGLLSALPGSYTYTLNGNLGFNAATATPFPATGTLAPAGLTINANVILNRSTSITELLAVTTGSLDLAANNITLKSTATGTARFAQTAVAAPFVYSGVGRVVVERWIPLRAGGFGRAYRLLAPTVNTGGSIQANWMETGMNTAIGTNINPVPLFGTQITGAGGNANGFDVTASNAASLYATTNGVTPGYTAIGSTTGTLNALTGYFLYVRGDRSMDMTLALDPATNPTSSTTLRTTGTLITGTKTEADFAAMDATNLALNLVTNPYASPIDWSLVRSDAGTTNLSNSYTLWDPNIGSRGGFATVTTGGVASGGSAATVNIQPGQAFFVQTSGGTPTIAIKEAHKVSGNNNGVFFVSPQYFGVSLYYTESNGYRRQADGVKVIYDDIYSTAIDADDAAEINNWDENIAINRDNKHLAIESRPVINKGDNIPLFMNNMKQRAYEFEFTPSAFTSTNLKAELVDNFLNTRTLLSVEDPTVVRFSVTANAASAAASRFTVEFGKQPVADVLTVSAKAVNNTVLVEWVSKTEKEMQRYEVERSLNTTDFTKINTTVAGVSSNVEAYYSFTDANAQVGDNFYRIKAIDKTGQIKYTDMAKVNFGKGNELINIAPNPVTGNTLNLQLNNMEKCTYQVMVYNNQGQMVYSTQLQHAGGSATVPVTLVNALSKGMYKLVLTGNNIRITNNFIKN